ERRFDSKSNLAGGGLLRQVQQNVAYLLSNSKPASMTPLGLTSTGHAGNTAPSANEPERAARQSNAVYKNDLIVLGN
ncbi:MAG: hypothetical protein WCC08_21675, partial [Terrimicrobiaceae bacterium]